MTISVLVAGSAVLLVGPAAQASRNTPPTTQPGYVPPPQYGQNPHPDPGVEPDPYAGSPTTVPVDLPAVVTPGAQGEPGAGQQGPGSDVLGENLGKSPAPESSQPAAKAPAKETGGGVFGGVLSRTGAETLPVLRVGFGAFVLGLGLMLLSRRRRRSAA